jgi:Ni,Fe-hydrogenase III small subunit
MENKLRKNMLKQMIEKRKQSLHTVHSKPCSLFIRHLDCGSCNACELELNALANPIYDSAQWGIHFEASPRHADILALTGPYVRSLDRAAQSTLEAMPVPRIVTIGDCAQNAGEFQNSYAIIPYPEKVSKAIIAHVPGCPPSPDDILRALFDIATQYLR